MSEWVIVPLAALAVYSTLLVINLRQGDHGKANFWFGLHLASMIVWSCGSFLAHLEVPGVQTLFWNRVLSAGSSAMPFVFFRFVQVFLHKERKKINIFAFLLFCIIQIANVLGLVIASAYVSEGKLINQYGPAVILPSISWPVFIGFSAWDLVKGYLKTKDSVYRNRIKYLLGSIIIIFGGTMTNTTGLSVYPIDIGFNVLAAGLIAYSILRYQLLDLSVVIRRSMLYSIPTMLIGAVYFLVLNLTWNLYNSFNKQQIFLVSLLVAMVSALVAQPVRDKAQLWIDRIFFRDKHDVGLMLQRVNRTAATVLDIHALTSMILKEINVFLHVSQSAFFLKSIDQEDFRLSTQEGLSVHPSLRFRRDHPIVKWLTSYDQILRRIDIEILPQFLSLWGQEREELVQLSAELFIPVKIKSVLVGILAIGPKRSEETFSREEHETLSALAIQTAVAIENARLFAEALQRTTEMTQLNQVIQAQLSERLRAEKALSESEERFRRLAENAPDLIYRYRTVPDSGYEFISPAVNQIIGYSPEEFHADPDLQFRILYHEDQRLFQEMVQGKLANGPVVIRLVRKDGSIVWTEQHSVPIYDSMRQLIAIEGIARDITLRKQNEEELAARIEQLERHNREINMLNEMGDLLQACQNREEAYPVINKYLRQLFSTEYGAVAVKVEGNNRFETVITWGADHLSLETFEPGSCWALRRGKAHLVDSPDEGMLCQHIRYMEIAGHLCMPMMAQGEALGLLSLMIPRERSREPAGFSLSKQQLAVTVAEHISLALANLKLNETLRHQAIRDPLTNLYNRRYMEETLERELARATRKNNSLAIIFIDIDHFKLFNDQFGHDVGDRVLRDLGHYFRSFIRGEDIACRYGGEEFILILPDTPVEVAYQRASEIQQQVKQLSVSLQDQSHLHSVTLSLGVAAFPQNGQKVETLLRSADQALYQAKQAGRDQVIVAKPCALAG